MIPVYDIDSILDAPLDLDRSIDLSTQFDLTDDNVGAIQEYVLGLEDYKTFTWPAPMYVHIRIKGNLIFKGNLFSQHIDKGEL